MWFYEMDYFYFMGQDTWNQKYKCPLSVNYIAENRAEIRTQDSLAPSPHFFSVPLCAKEKQFRAREFFTERWNQIKKNIKGKILQTFEELGEMVCSENKTKQNPAKTYGCLKGGSKAGFTRE
jgi:hypothetical protein